MISAWWMPVAVLSCAWACAAPAAADVFVLHSGGHVEGTLVNANEVPRQKYVVKTASGGELTLKRDQVKEVHHPKPADQDYAKARPQYPDTVDGQWDLAEWCREHKLTAERKRHLQRVIELDPDHKKARAALGYGYFNGQWKTKDEFYSERGYVKDKAGQWRVPQQIEDRERKQKQKEAEQEWYSNLRRWRNWMDGGRAGEAEALIQKIREPEAVPALAANLKSEQVESLRKMYVDALARVGTPDAWRFLAVSSLDDSVEEIRLTCMDYLEKQPSAGATDIYIKRLRSKDNVMVNRAGVGLARMHDPRAIRPLIDALVTKHQYIVQAAGGNMNNTFGNNGGGGGSFSFGAPQQQVIEREHANADVLDALVSLAGGANFQYDVRAWRGWLAAQKRTQNVDARRD